MLIFDGHGSIPMCIRRSLFSLLLLLFASFVMLTFVCEVPAALIAYDGFNYDAGTDNLGGKNGGIGWAVGNAWSATGGNGNPQEEVRSPGSTYSILETEGNKAWVSGGPRIGTTNGAVGASFRNLPGTIGTADGTVWVSFIGQREGTNLVRFFGLSFYQGGTASADERFTIGENSLNANDVWGMHFLSTAMNRLDVLGAPITTESFLLARIDYHGNTTVNDDIHLWVNYDITQGRPDVSTADASLIGTRNLAFDRVGVRAGSGTADGPNAMAYFDEIRIGDSFRDVATIPEPASLMLGLLSMGCLALIVRYHRDH
jgi:hypothetical protein